MSNEKRLRNITVWNSAMELKIKGPRSWDPVLFPVAKAAMSLVGAFRYPSSVSIVKTNAGRRSVVVWSDL